ncbi:MAG TPA: mersacidin/lichenicidin family type 2 lantibiotic [Thermoanaerobaculia bacterium]|jgi:type 2 lantibiotic, mersacidin/lichenicidin family|nr:mersacidin/lichenicidin family type 2 lantibiotic [Thermoanaerobaculia bacterium]
MKKNQIIEAWRDEDAFLSLSEEERAALPAHPSGVTVLEDEILLSITGGCAVNNLDSSAYCSPCGRVNCY